MRYANELREAMGVEKKEEDKKKEIERMIHPHDDEPDPTAYMGNYNFADVICVLLRVYDYVCIVN